MDPQSHSLIPVYREGFANPWHMNDWFDQLGMDPFRAPRDHWMKPPQEMVREMNRMMEPLFPFERPSATGSGQISWKPSAFSPKYDNNGYRVEIQAQDFKPNEITVKTVNRHNHNFLMAEGKHDTTDEAGYHSVHHFKRQYMLPDTVDPTTLNSKLDAKGMLTITAPVQKKSIKSAERIVPMETAITKK